ncbi:MAG: hypothetical protein IPI32_10225 [Austwickia sp.]|nr:hypothetical protein [Austwickia sp.]MBK8436133.1 hypothetical protein [Austwickia sp.]MBK9101812.1 hypothetical protein [Austwickia sp.]
MSHWVIPTLVLTAGAGLLLWGAEEFMEHIAALARAWRLPVIAMGLLLAGAEPEEMVTALIASGTGNPVLAATDALGANVTMTALGLGLALVATSGAGTWAAGGAAQVSTLRGYAVAAAGCGVLALLALYDGYLGRGEALALVTAYVALVAFIWRTQRRPPAFGELAENDDEDDDDHDVEKSSGRTLLMVALGLAAMVTGGALAVRGAAGLAERSGLGQQATGLTALAFATSIEVLALVAAGRRRQLTAVAVGGVLGSVIYNATLTLGLAAVVAPLTTPDLRWVAIIATVLPLALLSRFALSRPRPVGVGLLAAYAAYLVAALRTGVS